MGVAEEVMVVKVGVGVGVAVEVDVEDTGTDVGITVEVESEESEVASKAPRTARIDAVGVTVMKRVWVTVIAGTTAGNVGEGAETEGSMLGAATGTAAAAMVSSGTVLDVAEGVGMVLEDDDGMVLVGTGVLVVMSLSGEASSSSSISSPESAMVSLLGLTEANVDGELYRVVSSGDAESESESVGDTRLSSS